MDKKTIIGLVLICAVFMIFGWLNRPSEEQLAQQKRYNDSIAQVQKNNSLKNTANNGQKNADEEKELKNLMAQSEGNDSLKAEVTKKVHDKFAFFSNSALQDEKHFTLENDVFSIDLTNKGAQIKQVKLKDYKTYSKNPVAFFTENGNSYGLHLSAGQVIVSTKDLYFVPFINGKIYEGDGKLQVSGKDSLVLAMRLYPNKADSLNITDEDYYNNSKSYIEYSYILRGNDYRVGYHILFNNMNEIISDASHLEMNWSSDLMLKEKDIDIERKNSTIYYKLNDKVKHLKEQGRDETKAESDAPVKWISFKQQFFSAALICNNNLSWFDRANLTTETKKINNNNNYMRSMQSSMMLGYDVSSSVNKYSMDFFFGPNKYNIVKKYKINLERTIPLGWGFFLMQWVNRFFVIPIFDFLVNYGLSYGLIILILTLIVKIILFPLAYKSYAATAQMKVLQPEINKLNEQYPNKDQMMQKQEALRLLYRRAGINPTAGCWPMLIQFPILIAMFRFFPSSIELRQQSFLWADDLSTYDSFINLPFNIPFAGSHISLFCILMTIAQLIYTKMTMNQQSSTSAMPGMKFMMYGMPIMMFFILNNFSAALNYYYLLSLFISVIQMVIIRRTIDENKILQRLQTNTRTMKSLKKTKREQRFAKQQRLLDEKRKKYELERQKRKEERKAKK